MVARERERGGGKTKGDRKRRVETRVRARAFLAASKMHEDRPTLCLHLRLCSELCPGKSSRLHQTVFRLLRFVRQTRSTLSLSPSLLLPNRCMLRSLFRSTTSITLPKQLFSHSTRTMSTSAAQPAEKKQRLDGPKVSSLPFFPSFIFTRLSRVQYADSDTVRCYRSSELTVEPSTAMRLWL